MLLSIEGTDKDTCHPGMNDAVVGVVTYNIDWRPSLVLSPTTSGLASARYSTMPTLQLQVKTPCNGAATANSCNGKKEAVVGFVINDKWLGFRPVLNNADATVAGHYLSRLREYHATARLQGTPARAKCDMKVGGQSCHEKMR